MYISCAYCSGSGEHPDYHKVCPVCGGGGQVDVPSDHITCAYCSGTGEHPDYRRVCNNCNGTGVVKPARYS